MNTLQDKNGNTSSKRVAAFVALAVAVIVTGYTLITKTAEQNVQILTPWLMFAGVCLGIAGAEFFAPKDKE